MASSTLILGTLGANIVFGTGDADTISSETTREYTKEVQATNGLGEVVAIAHSAPVESQRIEKYGTQTTEDIGENGNIRVSVRRSNEDFARVTVERKALIAAS